jgi:hypothetical protein
MGGNVAMDMKNAVFKGKGIRKAIHNNEWWFSIVDVCAVLTGSADPGAYWRKLKQRLNEEGSEVVTFCHGLKLPQRTGRCEKTTAPTPKASPHISVHSLSQGRAFKRWLAKGWL